MSDRSFEDREKALEQIKSFLQCYVFLYICFCFSFGVLLSWILFLFAPSQVFFLVYFHSGMPYDYNLNVILFDYKLDSFDVDIIYLKNIWLNLLFISCSLSCCYQVTILSFKTSYKKSFALGKSIDYINLDITVRYWIDLGLGDCIG